MLLPDFLYGYISIQGSSSTLSTKKCLIKKPFLVLLNKVSDVVIDFADDTTFRGLKKVIKSIVRKKKNRKYYHIVSQSSLIPFTVVKLLSS